MSDTSISTSQKLFEKGIAIYKEELIKCIQQAKDEELLEYGIYLNEPEHNLFSKVKQEMVRQENIEQMPEREEIVWPLNDQLDAETIRLRLQEKPELIETLVLSEDHRIRIAENLGKNASYQNIIKGFSFFLKAHPQLYTNSDFWKLATEGCYKSSIGEGGLTDYTAELDIIREAIFTDKETCSSVSQHVQLWSTEHSKPGQDNEEWIETGELKLIWPDLISITEGGKINFENTEKLKEMTSSLEIQEARANLEKRFGGENSFS